MLWKNRNHVFNCQQSPTWGKYGALTPTPRVLNQNIVRVYAGFRDHKGVSRIGFVDLDANDPSRVVKISQVPALDIGRDGCFDDNGVILGDVIYHDGKYRMYYVGFQLVNKVKFLAFTGLAMSDDGENFTRVSDSPILDRKHGANMIHAIHTVLYRDNKWLAWAAQGDDWQIKDGQSYPCYEIWQLSSSDGISFEPEMRKVIGNKNNEYRIGRPSVFVRPDSSGLMFYTRGYADNDKYQAGMAVSQDLMNWDRCDEQLKLGPDKTSSFDSRHLAYPRLFELNDRYYAVYNGNDMGRHGFGLIECTKW